MSVRLFARGCGVLLPALAVAIAHGQPPAAPAPKAESAAWTFDEARDRLAVSPRDNYLQYVVLQLGRRDGREKEAQDAVDRPTLLGGLLGNGGRRSQANLFATFTGALAVQESLQLDTMRGEPPPGRPRQPGTPEPKGPQGKVAVSTLSGPTVPSHPWEKMLGGKTPDVGPLAGLVPEEYYLAEFRSAVRLHEVLGTG
ncbi:MAG TPA: hypothetical protein VD866_15510, partial [Urbifossiella sp.]|nr:hypothetical protein [Urbifossiella sp.]